MLENSETDLKNYRLLAKFYRAISKNLDKKYIGRLLEEYDVNYKVPENTILKFCKPILINLTALDFLTERDALERVPYEYMRDILEILLSKGANFINQNDDGITALHRAIYDRLNLFNNYFAVYNMDNAIEALGTILSAHVNTKNSTNPVDKNGLSHFHIACMANHVEAVEFFLSNGVNVNETVRSESPHLPGFTPLHLTVKFGAVNVADVLLKNGADLHVKDAKGFTPLQLLMRLSIEISEKLDTLVNYYYKTDFPSIEPIMKLLLEKENENFEVNYMDDVGFSLLHAACLLADTSMVEFYLGKGCDVNAAVSENSQLCPGYTNLHFAAHFQTDTFKILFENGADIEMKDAKGVTPFDIIVTRARIEYIHTILTTHLIWKNILLSDGKTKLTDLVWAMREFNELEAFLDRTNFNTIAIVPIESPLWPGYTLLHLAILLSEAHKIELHPDTYDTPDQVNIYMEKIEFLVRRGADVFTEDSNGLAPWKLAQKLGRNNAVSYFTEVHPEILTDVEYSDPNGEDDSDKKYIFYELLSNLKQYDQVFMDELRANVDRQRQIERDFGLTMLHVACWELDVDWVKDLLTTVDVNAQTHSDLPCWIGYTPLHVLMMRSTEDVEHDDRIDVILQLLLEKGADMMLTRGKGSTAIHATEVELAMIQHYPDHPRGYASSPYTGLLLRRLKSFNFNPINHHGISLFQIACMRNDLPIIERFLEHGVDVNEPVNPFSDKYAGWTPLHLAMKSGPFADDASRKQTMDLLMSRGADLFAEDSQGNTLLHAAAKSNQPREELLEQLISLGLDVNATNTVGDTPLASLLNTDTFTIEELNVFTKRGCQLRSFNPINQTGFISGIFRTCRTNGNEYVDYDRTTKEKLFNVLSKIEMIDKLDDLGRSVIHNVVSGGEDGYIRAYFIDCLIEQGCDVDHRDNLGKTALHIAADLKSFNVMSLLEVGADVNVVDKYGKSAFFYNLKAYNEHKHLFEPQCTLMVEQTMRAFVEHVKMMQHCGLYISEHIAEMQEEAAKIDFMDKNMHTFEDDPEEDEYVTLYKHIDKSKNVKFGSIILYDFLSESRAMKACRSASSTEYDAINNFFLDVKNDVFDDLCKVFYIAKRVYKKTSARLSLLKTATGAISVLLGFPVPDVCSAKIFVFLSNKDLENLIASSM